MPMAEIILTDGSTLRAYDSAGTELWNTTTESSIQLIADVTGDEVPEIITSQLSGSTLRMHIYNTSGALLKTIDRSCVCGSCLWPVAASDFDGDGDIEILASMGSDCGNPCGVSLFDYNNATEEWHYDVGPWPIRGAYGDINEYGIMDVVMGGYTVNNGHTGCGVNNSATCTSDSSFYTIVFSAVDGTEMFTKKYSAGFVHHAIVDLDHDENYNILAFEGHDPTYYQGTSKISLIDSAGTALKTWSGPNDISLNDYAVGDLNNDGYDEIAFVGGDNVLRILDQDFNLLTSTPGYKHPMHSSIVVVINDINGDGTNELLAQDPDHTMIRVFDVNLSELGNFSIADPHSIIVSDLDNDGVNEVICTGATDVKVFSAIGSTTDLYRIHIDGKNCVNMPFVACLTDTLGNPIANGTIIYSLGGAQFIKTTDTNGYSTFTPTTTGTLLATYGTESVTCEIIDDPDLCMGGCNFGTDPQAGNFAITSFTTDKTAYTCGETMVITMEVLNSADAMYKKLLTDTSSTKSDTGLPLGFVGSWSFVDMGSNTYEMRLYIQTSTDSGTYNVAGGIYTDYLANGGSILDIASPVSVTIT